MNEHFSSGLCKGATFSVQVIEKLSGSGRDESGKVDPGVAVLHRKKATEWMLRLRTVYPYGLNDRVGDEYMPEKDHSNICSKFPSLKQIQPRHKIRTKSAAPNTNCR